MNDIVIPLGPTMDNHEELRYALRSIEKNVKNYRDIWIIGELPEWITNVKNIPHSDDWHPKWKERNIWKKICAACINREVSDDFTFFNDDHFILSEIDATDYPYYYKGSVSKSIRENRSVYRKTMTHTVNFLLSRGFQNRNADTHCPIIYNKKKFLNSFNHTDFNTPYGYGIKSIYCAVNRVDMVLYPDCKIKEKETYDEVVKKAEGRHVISCYDGAMQIGFGEFIREMFPEPSKYEL